MFILDLNFLICPLPQNAKVLKIQNFLHTELDSIYKALFWVSATTVYQRTRKGHFFLSLHHRSTPSVKRRWLFSNKITELLTFPSSPQPGHQRVEHLELTSTVCFLIIKSNLQAVLRSPFETSHCDQRSSDRFPSVGKPNCAKSQKVHLPQ